MKLFDCWPHVRLGDVCLKIGSGSTPRGGDSVYQESGTALIRSQNVYNGVFTFDGIARLSDHDADRLSSVTIEQNDVLLNITGDSVARCCQVPQEALPARVNQHVAIIRPNSDRVNPRFLCYYLISPLMQSYLLSIAGNGGTRKALTKGMLEDFQIPCPSLEVQGRIIDLVGSYDDLIENNRRRMELLEASARHLYEEWFVRLRFPGHEHTRIVNGVPEGWEILPLESVAEFRLGKMLDQVKNKGEARPYLANVNVRWGQIELTDLREMRFEEHEMDAFGLKYGDIVMCEGGEPGRCAIWKDQLPGMMIQKAIHRIRARAGVDYSYLYYCLRHLGLSGQLATLFTGATIKHLPREKLAKVSVMVPTARLADLFKEQVHPIERQIALLQSSSRKASEARDLLLPRLMSGEVAV